MATKIDNHLPSHPPYKLIGKNYRTPDLVAKVTGRAKYAEDFRAEGMLFCRQLLSPEPHARVRRVDARAALAMSGVAAVLTADELPIVRPDPDPTGAEESEDGSPCLTNEPVFEGEPILAVAAVDEAVAAQAIEQIHVELERPPVECPGMRKRARRQRSVTSTPDSSRPTSFWTRRSFSNRRRTSRSRRARRWPTGGMASCTSTARRRASLRRFPFWR